MKDMVNEHMERRSFLKQLSLGTAGIALGATGLAGCSSMNNERTVAVTGLRNNPLPAKSTVSFVANKDSREAAYQALKPLKSEIEKAIGKKQVVIKINAGQVTKNVWLNATDANFTRGILDFLKEFYDRKVIITESTAASTTVFEGFENYGFTPLAKEYNVELRDMNDELFTQVWILDNARHPMGINILNPMLDPNNFVISPTRLKTHNNIIATLSLKNIAMGSPANHYKQASRTNRNEKQRMHEGLNRGLSYNLFRLASYGIRPDLAVLDGVVGMEGNGPVNGTPVEQGVAIASTDFVAADRLGFELMGVDYSEIKYMQWCKDAGMGNDEFEKINIIGPDYKPHIVKYKPNPSYEQQRAWVHEDYKI
jgi:uncharacterized protein (DUF362 family)